MVTNNPCVGGELALLLAAADELVRPGQDALDLGDLPTVGARMDEVADWTATDSQGALPVGAPGPSIGGRPAAVTGGGRVVGTAAMVLWKTLTRACTHLGFGVLADEGFRAMVLARIVEPTSKAEAVWVLAEVGAPDPSLRTLFRSLARAQAGDFRGQLAKACLAHTRLARRALARWSFTASQLCTSRLATKMRYARSG